MEKNFKEKLEEILKNYQDSISNSKKLASLWKDYSFDIYEINESLDDSISYLKDSLMCQLENKIDELKSELDKQFDEIDKIVEEKKVW